MKFCPGCRLEKPLQEFYKDASKRDGVHSTCKACKAITDRKRYKENYVERPRSTIETKDGITTKFCPKCWKRKEINEFYNNSSSFDGLTTYCRLCTIDYNFHRTYGITKEQYDEIYKNQNGLCCICSSPPNPLGKTSSKSLHLDHDHLTNEVRGLLCHSCNVSLGGFRDSPELLRKAADYIENYRQNRRLKVVKSS